MNGNHILAEGKEEEKSTKKLTNFYNPMCFIDIEMTDPDPKIANIVEIAAYLVNGDLSEKYLIADFVITQPDVSVIKSEFVVERFKKNGLWDDIQNPDKSLELNVAEELIMSELMEYGILERSVPSAGIQTYNDRILLERLMPKFHSFLSFT